MRYKNRIEQRQRRHWRVRNKVSGTAARPRMALFVSNKHMYVQFVDDEASHTLAAACTAKDEGPNNCERAKRLGAEAAKAALAKGIAHVVVDRGGFQFHGRVKQIVDAAVEAGLSVKKEEQ